MRKFLPGLLMLLMTALAAAAPEQGRLAWLQDKNIFHSGLQDTHTVALTFDDGPNAHTDEVLDVLRAENVPATFFIVGRMAHLHPGLLQRIAAEGHLLGNHSASHTPFDQEFAQDPQLLLDELHDVDDQIRPLAKGGPYFFRAPYALWRPEFARILNADSTLKQYIGPVYWDIGGKITFDRTGALMSAADWQCWQRDWDVADCAEGYLSEIHAKNGGVVLLHCIHAQSAGLLKTLLDVLESESFKFVRLDQVPAYRQFEQAPAQLAPVAVSLR